MNPEKRKALRLKWKHNHPNYFKDWYIKNRERVLKKQKEYGLKHKQKKSIQQKKYRDETHYNLKYYAKNKERIRLHQTEFYKKNRESYLDRNKRNYDPIKRKEDYIKNREDNLKRVREWRLKNKEYVKQYRKEFERKPERIAYRKKWNKENPRSRAGNYPLEMEIAMNLTRKRFNNTCQWQGCGLTFREAPIHVHHIFPRSEYPELELIENYMICYCANHHAMFHRYRGDPYSEMISWREENDQYAMENYH